MKKNVWIVYKYVCPYDDERDIINSFIKDDVSREWKLRDSSATEINYDEDYKGTMDHYNVNFITAERHDLLE
jgi:hypothetical protein